MTDKYADLRDALAAGPTPGVWTQGARGPNGCPIVGSGPLMVAMLAHSANETSQASEAEANAAYITAANPETIRALLDERDALREALWVATEHNALHFGESNNTVTQGRAALAQHQGA